MSLSAWLAPAAFVGVHLGVAAGVAGMAYAFGSRLTAAVPWSGPAERVAGATAIGLAAFGQMLFLLGLAGWLRPLPVALMLAGALAVSVRGQSLRGPWSPSQEGTERAPRAVAAAMAVAAVPLLLLPLYPPTGFDATMYHLPFAKAFAATGGLPPLPDLRFPVFPQLNEVLFAGALLLWDDLGAQLLQALAGLLTAGLLVTWEGRDGSRTVGLVAAACWLGTPMVVQLSGAGYVDLGTTLFFTLAAFALDRWRRGGERIWLTVAAFAAGCAAASKYTGLFAVAGVVLLALWDGRERRLRAAGWAALVAGLTAGPWYLRIYLLTGNPVHPCFAELFGGEPTPLFGSAATMLAANGGFGPALLSWVKLPWTLVAASPSVGWIWSAAYLLGLPLALWAAVREPWGRRAGVAILVFSLVFALLSFPDARLLLPIAPLWCHLIGRGYERLSLALLPAASRGRAAVVAVTLVALLPGLWKGIGELRWRGLPPTRNAERAAYLRLRLPAYAALEHLNRTRGSRASVYAFFAENLAYYAEGRYQGDWFGPAAYTGVFSVMAHPDAFADRLRELGADHLLIAAHGPYPQPVIGDTAVFAHRFELIFADSGARLFRVLEH
jgi:hypothetical protein